MNRRSLGAITLLFFILTLAVSAAVEGNDSQIQANITESNETALFGIWNLTEIKLVNATPTIDLTNANITINITEQGSISGNSGCNRYFGSYNLTSANLSTGSGITISSVGSTMMYCDKNMEIEQTFLKILESVKSYNVEEKSLLLADDIGNALSFMKSQESENS
jgi:heat shock protein HslJ